MPETDLYLPVKRFLEHQGYVVKSEVRHCDLVARRGDEPPLIVELKSAFSLELLFQGIDRLALTDAVYIATATPRAQGRSALLTRRRRSMVQLCRRLGLGLMTVGGRVNGGMVEVLLDPAPYRPRQNSRRVGLLLKEFARRVGDPNQGGSVRRPIVTAYRQDALRCVNFIDGRGSAKLSEIRQQARVDRAAGILQRDVYGWFIRIARGTYALSPRGQTAVAEFGKAIEGM